MIAPVVSIKSARGPRLLKGERVELPSLIDCDSEIAELEGLLSAERLRGVELDPCSILHQWSIELRLSLDEQLGEALKLRAVVLRRATFVVHVGGRRV